MSCLYGEKKRNSVIIFNSNDFFREEERERLEGEGRGSCLTEEREIGRIRLCIDGKAVPSSSPSSLFFLFTFCSLLFFKFLIDPKILFYSFPQFILLFVYVLSN
jgi:hypothetical protein